MSGNGLTLLPMMLCVHSHLYFLFFYFFICCCLLLLIIISEHIEDSTDVSFQTQFFAICSNFQQQKVPKTNIFHTLALKQTLLNLSH